MTTSDPQTAFVWTWLPGAGEPVVAGRMDAGGPLHMFTYARSYRERTGAVPLYEPELPLAPGTLRPAGGLTVAGCLRDGGPDSWGQRVILARHAGHSTSASDVSELSLLAYLLESGSDRIGGLDFQRSAIEYAPRTGSSATLEQLVAAAADLEAGRMLASPLAEAQGVAMDLARRAGLNVAPAQVIQVAGKDVLLVKRFDRPGGGRRRHLVSALTILGLDEFTGARYGSYALLADHIRQSVTDPAATLRELFSRIVFSILVGNTDDHPRNHAAFVNADGSLTLTPAYDICSQPRSVPQANQAMAIGRNGERSSQLATCLAACQIYLLDTAQAQSIIDAQLNVIQAQWRDAADAARLTELERQQLLRREILNEFAFRP